MTRMRIRKVHARYDSEEKGFLCLICEEAGLDWVYSPCEIPKHLKEHHKINRKQQNILDWNEKFEKEYLKNRNRPMVYEFEPSVVIDTTPPKKYEEERKRRLMEAKARREAIS